MKKKPTKHQKKPPQTQSSVLNFILKLYSISTGSLKIFCKMFILQTDSTKPKLRAGFRGLLLPGYASGLTEILHSAVTTVP